MGRFLPPTINQFEQQFKYETPVFLDMENLINYSQNDYFDYKKVNSSPVSTYVRLLGSDCNPGITNKATPDHGLDLEVDVLELEPVYCV